MGNPEESKELYGYDKSKIVELAKLVLEYTTFQNKDSYPNSICNKVCDISDVFVPTDNIWVGESYEAYKNMFAGVTVKLCQQIANYGVICNNQLLGIVAQLDEQIRSITPEE